MNRLAAGEVPDLEPAREPRRDDDGRRVRPGAPPARGAARRPAARPRNARPRSRTSRPCRSSRRRGRSPRHPGSRRSSFSIGPTPTSDRWWQCAWTQDPAWARLQVEPRTGLARQDRCEEFLERQAGRGDDLGLATQLALEQRGIVVLDRQDAARLAGDDRPTLRAPIRGAARRCAGRWPRPGRAGRWRSAAGRSSAGPGGPSVTAAARPPEQLDRRLADLRLEVVGEGVGEEQDRGPGRARSAAFQASSAANRRDQRSPRERRREAAAVDPQQLLVEPAARAGSAPASSTPAPARCRSGPARRRGRRPGCASGRPCSR